MLVIHLRVNGMGGMRPKSIFSRSRKKHVFAQMPLYLSPKMKKIKKSSMDQVAYPPSVSLSQIPGVRLFLTICAPLRFARVGMRVYYSQNVFAAAQSLVA